MFGAAQKLSEEVSKNTECFVSEWVKANPTANIKDYRLEYAPYFDINNNIQVMKFRIVKENN